MPQLDRVRVVEVPRAIADAELTSEEGRTVRPPGVARQSRIRAVRLYELRRRVPARDGTAGATARQRQLELGDVAYVMISVDGERDTPAAMKTFLERYPEEFIGLTAAPNRVAPLAEQFSAAFFQGAHSAHGKYDVAHSPQIFVLDAAGKLRAELFGASIESMTAVAIELLSER